MPVLLTSFWGCGSDSGVDVDPPAMQILSLNPMPSAGMICGTEEDTVFNVLGGQTLQAELRFMDNASLSQYKVDIHNNFDCHGHGGAVAPGVAPPGVESRTEDWTVLDIQPLSGTAAQATLSLEAPEQVTAGAYHFQIQVLDEAGNDNPLANFYSIKVLNPVDTVAPNLTISAPAGEELTVAKGATVSFAGTVTDNYSLSEGGNGLVFLNYTDLSSGNTFSTDAYVAFDETVEKLYDFEISFEVPQTLKAGAYRFRLAAYDGVRNTAAPRSFEVAITD